MRPGVRLGAASQRRARGTPALDAGPTGRRELLKARESPPDGRGRRRGRRWGAVSEGPPPSRAAEHGRGTVVGDRAQELERVPGGTETGPPSGVRRSRCRGGGTSVSARGRIAGLAGYAEGKGPMADEAGQHRGPLRIRWKNGRGGVSSPRIQPDPRSFGNPGTGTGTRATRTRTRNAETRFGLTVRAQRPFGREEPRLRQTASSKARGAGLHSSAHLRKAE